MNTISPTQLYERFQQGEPIELIDVRTPAEFRAVHLSFARPVPLERLDPAGFSRSRNGSSGQPLYVICQSGGRGAKACAALAAAGCDQVVNVEGGTEAWVAADLPVVRGKSTISLERQVRIAAGLLVLVGSVLGYFVHPYFMAVPAFVGAGLAFAGITNTCGMAMMLARMPWNQADTTDPPSNTCCQS
jgi:rhodanese-related sulfurtransferase